METDFKNIILDLLKKKEFLSKREIIYYIGKKHPEIQEPSINWQLHQLKIQGLLQTGGYGKYTLAKPKIYEPSVSISLKRIYNKVSRDFPFADFCVWESNWFNEFMLHQLFRFYLVVEVEKDAVESVFNALSDQNKKVFLNPDEEIFNRYILNFNQPIIVKSLISEAPLIEQQGKKLASLEKLLVDCLADKPLFAAQQDEKDFIFKSVFEKYDVNISKLKRYARRRNQLENIEILLHNNLAKTA